MDITPMIDVTFLLLIFFILTNNASKTSAVELPNARNNIPVNSQESVVLTIFKVPDGEPQVYLSKGKKENGPASLSEVTSYVREGILQDKRNVIILSDMEVPSGFVEEVALAASEASEEELRYFTGVLAKKK